MADPELGPASEAQRICFEQAQKMGKSLALADVLSITLRSNGNSHPFYIPRRRRSSIE
jgi:hypothetical protein